MDWHLVHTKPRQEKRALQNLEQQGYQCYFPTRPLEKIRHKKLVVEAEPLFPRYLFIRLAQENSGKGWSSVRSTKGVNRLVSFGNNLATVSNELIEHLRMLEASFLDKPQLLFTSGERVRLTAPPFAGIEGIYKMPEGEQRVMVLIEMMSKMVTVRVPLVSLRKAS